MIFETKALVPPDAPDIWNLPYYNLVISGTTTLSPHALLAHLKGIEKALGRDLNAPRWAPRIIDLDILAWDEQVISHEGLTIPHPELFNRPFLLTLMASLRADWRYPVQGFPYSHLTLNEILHSYVKQDPEATKCFMPFPQLMGIVNITPDSFSDGGRYCHAEAALQKILALASQGAAVIDIGGQSTRPNARQISAEEEWQRLEPVLKLLAQELPRRLAWPHISLDSYHPEVISKALQIYPIDWVNDVKAGEDIALLKIVAEKGCKIVLNHSLAIPPRDNLVLPFELNPLTYLLAWAEKKVEELGALGISPAQIILDPGIGFGKSLFQTLSVLREVDQLKKSGCQILVGHSRKSFFKMISSSEARERDFETVGISHYLSRKGVDYLRVHNVEAHQKSLTASALLEGLHVF